MSYFTVITPVLESKGDECERFLYIKPQFCFDIFGNSRTCCRNVLF